MMFHPTRTAMTLLAASCLGSAAPARTAASSKKTRAERKAETSQAWRDKQMTPAGEGPGAPTK